VSDQSIRLADPILRQRLTAAIDREAKIPRALDALGQVSGRRVVVLDAEDGLRVRQLEELGGLVRGVSFGDAASVERASADVVVSCWSGIRPGEEEAAGQVAEAMRILDPAGKLLVVHDYGRDDLSTLLGPPEREQQLLAWSHRHGPFLRNGFKLRVLHCWWSWDSVEEAVELLRDVFGAPGEAVGAAMRRPRLSYKVAVYHRGHEAAVAEPVVAA
jgi:hypothetical protein